MRGARLRLLLLFPLLSASAATAASSSASVPSTAAFAPPPPSPHHPPPPLPTRPPFLPHRCRGPRSRSPSSSSSYPYASSSSSSSSAADVSADASADASAEDARLSSLSSELSAALEACAPAFYKNVKVSVGPSPSGLRLGLLAAEDLGEGAPALSVPYDDQIVLSADLAAKTVLRGILPDGYDGWTGEVGLIAMLVLNELARADDGADDSDGGMGVPLPKRKPEAQNLIGAWVRSLPTPEEMSTLHPLLWDEYDQEVLQSSSTKKIYRTLDDVDEDSSWLTQRIWSADRTRFPESVTIDGTVRPCFNSEGYTWAIAIATSRSYFVDGALRLIPILDFANHDDGGAEEVRGGTMGTFGTTKGAELRAYRKYKRGEEVFASYGPKSAADYLLEHGFVPPRATSTAVSELTFEVSPDDRFRDDKLDVLEFETYDSAPMEPTQSFDVVAEAGGEGAPDPAMVQFLRLVKLGGKDAFLLESIFRKEVWEFMASPVSEQNECEVCDAIIDACEGALKDMENIDPNSGPDADDGGGDASPSSLCAAVREAERRALTRTLEYVRRDRETLDLKEYYQERRLKDLGLDSEWSEDDANPDVGWGQTRAPGGGDLDW